MVRSLSLVLVLASLSAPAFGDWLYATDADNFYRVDAQTGAHTLIGPHGAPAPIGALEWIDGTLYGVSLGYSYLYTIDTATGEAESVGALQVGALFGGGLAWDGQSLWATNQGFTMNNPNIVTVDPSSGQASIVGDSAQGTHNFNGLTWQNGDLYAIDMITDSLWRLEPSAPENSAPVGDGFGDIMTLGNFADLAGTYGFAGDSDRFFTMDFATGAPTLLGASTLDLHGLAVVPEPASVALVLLGAACVWRRR